MPDVKLRNKSMERKLQRGECLCVRDVGIQDPANVNHFMLPEFVAGSDYCDSFNEQWIWTIGRHRQTGAVIASLQVDLYQHPEYVCLFVRC